jgi:FdrA protein
VYGNISLPGVFPLDDVFRSFKHSCVDMGEDVFTVGRPHPMLAPDLRYERLMAEATDPSAGVIVLDIVLGYGVHPDPASEFADYIKEAKSLAYRQGRHLPIIVNVCGVDEDPQARRSQVEIIEDSGALVVPTNSSATRLAIAILTGKIPQSSSLEIDQVPGGKGTDLGALPFDLPMRANVINMGLAAFAESLDAQKIPVTHVDFRPPAMGDETLAELLSSMI